VLQQLVVLSGIGRQLGTDGEELALNAKDDGVPAAILDDGAGRPERRDGFIDGAVRLGVRIGFCDAASIQKAGLSPIPGFRDDALARDVDVLGGAAGEDFLGPLLQDLSM
jgi:hypothetical protein